jgi:hypothetical protein
VHREESIPLPRAVIERALETSTDRGFADLIARAFSRILDGSPRDRVAMMSAALPLTADRTQVFSYPCVVQSDQFRRFEEFCQEKRLNSVPLIAGAMIMELGIAEGVSGATGSCPSE